MSHFAQIVDGIVVQVIVAEQEFVDTLEGEWIQTSYNNNFRKNYAGIGYTYDKSRDAFIPPKPGDEFILDEETCGWVLPPEEIYD